MKRTFIISLMLFMTFALHAQSDLQVSPLFEGKIIPQERMVVTRVKGGMMQKYRLSFFHSVAFDGTEEEANRVSTLVDKEEYIGSSDYQSKKVKTLKRQLPAKKDNNRFLCFKSNKKGKDYHVIVVYMEGALASLKELEMILIDQ
ncbi:MAG: hypothetical protein IKX36_08825 [Prevotella sp.]|nr:hypothetical protein [Prevotella sp.]